MAKKKNKDDNAHLFADDETALSNQKPVNEFEALLNASGSHARGLSVGDRFRGEVLAITGQEAFLSTGTPTDAVLVFDANSPAPKVGEFIDAVVVRTREGEILAKAVGSRGGDIEMDNLEDAFDMEIPVDGTVLEAVKGGFRVKVMGQKAFCPISQIDWRCVHAEEYVAKTLSFIITKMERGRDLVVSRRKVLELERAASEGDFINSAQPGDIFSATVVRIEKYGAFIRLASGIEGLIPISELSWGRIHHPQEVVGMGQTVQVKLLKAEEDGDRLKVSFSLKQGGTVADPWESIQADFPVGTQIEGTVEHKEPFGIFVNIALGVTGLLPRSAWRDAIDGNQYENKKRGDRVKVRVERVDLDNHKLSFSLPREDEDDSWRSHASVQAQSKPGQGKGAGTTGGGNGFGTLGDLFKDIKGKPSRG